MKTWILGALAAAALAPAAQAQVAPAPLGQAPAVTPVRRGIVEDPCAGVTREQDWAFLCKYHAANAATPAPQPGRPRVVFIGDSITEGWVKREPGLFASGDYIGRGISAQTTPQMLVRFMPDVVALKPQVVHIMAGTNDIAGNTGPNTYEGVEANIVAMATLARANGIKVILASVPPAYDFYWAPGMNPGPQVAALNQWIRAYAAREGFTYVDYGPVLADEKGAVRAAFSSDGIHPNTDGYLAMAPLTQSAIAKALKSQH